MSIFDWYWAELCVCQDSADRRILDRAKEKYDTGYTYQSGADGANNKINCYYLVANSLKDPQLGYNAAARDKFLLQSDAAYYSKYFCQVPLADAGPGDIVDYEQLCKSPITGVWVPVSGGHVGILDDKLPRVLNGQAIWVFFVFGAHNEEDQITTIMNDITIKNDYEGSLPSANYEGGPPYTGAPCKYTITVWRPKECFLVDANGFFPVIMDTAPKRGRVDPLILDLDGSGVRTVGYGETVFFDHDGNGSKELTGWVAPGDGVLMFDRNGNGLLDDGQELFGDYTLLPNGMISADGFEALAYYDSNADRKIDSSDLVWPQLRVWRRGEIENQEGFG